MDVLVLIDKLDDLVHNAKAVPLTDQVRIDREEIARYQRGLIDVVVCNVSSDAAYQGGYTRRDGSELKRLQGNDAYPLKPGEAFAFTLDRLEQRVEHDAREIGLEVRFFQTNFDGEYVEELHRAHDLSDALILNPGACTHYSWAIRDALEVAALPAVEVHLSDVQSREEWRRTSVIGDLCVTTISGEGLDGYVRALERLKQELS